MVAGRAEPQEVPGRVDEGVHRVGLAHGRAAAAWAPRFEEALVALERRLAGRQELDVLGQKDGQVGLGDPDDAVGGAVDDGDRAPPVALPADQPVPQPVLHRALAEAPLHEPFGRPFLRRVDVEAVEETAVDLRAGPGPGLAREVVGGRDGADDRQVVGDGEVVVALVLGGDGHDRPGAVGRDHVVGDVDRHRLTGERVDAPAPGVGAAFGCRDVALQALPVGFARRRPAELGHRGGAARGS